MSIVDANAVLVLKTMDDCTLIYYHTSPLEMCCMIRIGLTIKMRH